MNLTHINNQGRAKMVDVGSKEETEREAIAYGYINMKRETLNRINEGSISKGDVLSVAQVAGIMAAKNTANIIPMCHPIMINGCDINFKFDFENNNIDITSSVKNTGKTGVEMEALTAVTVAALAIYDMCKAIDREMIISDIKLMRKNGGKSGLFQREEL
ncbi:cyclic pyranopterin monophosphate synthase MoaC [Clostridium sporogenes]|uniref:Cyclic pyranopterin monophosphate synthase n=1 Tax=Clostridium botulinum TaxID=1491 RepID=A0A6M0SVY6_CLOBO|nr:cyclic pyranopterin monophosphate synthase MoaC [Clostridium sporogenes]NFA59679.1 cyclic pyranopterin monophosphate synthase MoaC [Clostridium botulinum]NFI73190.1 cyclic pyranopterin monophosphate synthase MoaC [Clostridium sporogenes]NFL74082.1 cyclic pyranopterin monophosphate synthase MoaC [Clostridium sporogenes]NFM24749.1 cyclic pyranopterin monophosphate synthase MoaC [Clostridium sporogenes]NFP60602.1 cyclic pyranopterin monophosphate synthase MoaC [Clostridium sporogenes]